MRERSRLILYLLISAGVLSVLYHFRVEIAFLLNALLNGHGLEIGTM